MEVVDQLDREIQTVTGGCYYGLNFISPIKIKTRLWKMLGPVLHQVRKFLVLAVLTYSSIRHALCILLEDKTWKWLSGTTTVLMDLKTILIQQPSIHRLPHPWECPTASIGSWSCPFKYPSRAYVPTPPPSSLLQPIYQGTITMVNSYYTFSTTCRILDESEMSFSVIECYKLYSLAECIVKIKGSMAPNDWWKKLWHRVH